MIRLVWILLFASSLSVSNREARAIAERIWHNECRRTKEGLTHWNEGESFASLGIGHFIWYPEGQPERFQEMFPELLAFLKQRGVSIPSWIAEAKGCPWKSREAFFQEMESERMQSLRQFLYETKEEQACFMAERLEKSFSQILIYCPEKEREKIRKRFFRLAKDSKGLYALIDYLNFKGAGISESETYAGEGWGLRQVLQKMSDTCKDPVADFVRAAKEVLQRRVDHAPADRNETRWLKGWFSRLDSYTSTSMKE